MKFFEITKKTNLENVRGMSIKSEEQSKNNFLIIHAISIRLRKISK